MTMDDFVAIAKDDNNADEIAHHQSLQPTPHYRVQSVRVWRWFHLTMQIDRASAALIGWYGGSPGR